MSAVVDERLTLKEFYREYEGRRAYLIDGVAYLMPPPNPPHAYGTQKLREVLVAITPPNACVREEKPLEIGTATDPEPDVAVVLGALDDFQDRHPSAVDALLLVEVADSSMADDRRRKLPKYAAAGIQEVWIVDLRRHEVAVYRDPAEGRYPPPETYRQGQSITPLFAPGSEVLVGRWAGR